MKHSLFLTQKTGRTCHFNHAQIELHWETSKWVFEILKRAIDYWCLMSCRLVEHFFAWHGIGRIKLTYSSIITPKITNSPRNGSWYLFKDKKDTIIHWPCFSASYLAAWFTKVVFGWRRTRGGKTATPSNGTIQVPFFNGTWRILAAFPRQSSACWWRKFKLRTWKTISIISPWFWIYRAFHFFCGTTSHMRITEGHFLVRAWIKFPGNITYGMVLQYGKNICSCLLSFVSLDRYNLKLFLQLPYLKHKVNSIKVCSRICKQREGTEGGEGGRLVSPTINQTRRNH